MKIERFTENSTNKTIYIVTDQGITYSDTLTYLLDNEESAFNLIANKVYSIFKNECEKEVLDENLLVLDECSDIDALIEHLNDSINEGILGDYESNLYYDRHIIENFVKLKPEISLRRAAKKYNL